MATLNEQLAKEKEAWEQLKLLQRAQKRDERLEKRKEDNHRIFLIGELFIKHCPVAQEIPVYKGKNAKRNNAASFAPMERVLSALTANEELMAQLEEGIRRQLSAGGQL